MDSNWVEAAVKGDIEPFEEKQQHLQQLVTSSGETILHKHIKSSKTPSTEFVKNILDICPSLLSQANDEDGTPLHVAAKYGHSAIMEVLLKCARHQPHDQETPSEILGTCPSLLLQVNAEGDTPLHVAAESGDCVMVEFLLKCAKDQPQELESGERVKWKMMKMMNKHGRTTLDEAVRHGKIEVVKILIKEAELDFYYIVNNLRGIVNLAAKRGDHEVLVAVENFESRVLVVHGSLGGMPDLRKALMAPGTILHSYIAFGNMPSPEFVEKILDICPSLLLNVDYNDDTPLHVAAKYGNSTITELLLKQARDQGQELQMQMLMRMRNQKYNTALQEAVLHGNTEVVEVLIKKADPDISYFVNKSNKTPLYLAVVREDYEMVATIINSDIRGTQSPDTILHICLESKGKPSKEFLKKILEIRPSLLLQVNPEGETPLHVAAKYGHSTIVEVLLKHARDQPQEQEGRERDYRKMLNMKNKDGNTTLDEAVQHGKNEVVKILIKEADLDFSYFANNFGKILYLAAETGDHEMVAEVAKLRSPELVAREGHNEMKTSIAAIIDAEIPGAQFMDTLFHIHIKSSKGPSNEFLEKILEICPSLILKCDDKGDTPLHVAAKCGYSHVAEVLLQYARYKYQKLESGQESESRVDWMMLRSKNKESNTALHEAVLHDKANMVEILTKDAEPYFSYFPNTSGETPLYLAAASGDVQMVRAILESCNLAAYEGPNGMTALHAAVLSYTPGEDEYNKQSLTREIFNKKMSLTKETDYYGWTPLHYAAYYGFNDVVNILLEFDKSAAYIPDKDQKMMPSHIAASQGHKDIVRRIIYKCVECYEKVDSRGWNVLHFLMLSLKKEDLLDLLKNPLVRSLINKRDKDGNTPLHIRAAAYRDSFSHIGDRRAMNKQSISVEHILKYGSHKLEEEIQKLFEDVGNGQYPEGIIRENKDEYYSKIRDERRKKYYDGLKETRSSQLLVATLIATVTFTAAFTIPGGYSNEKGLDEGTAILNKNLAFQIFIMTDTIAMTLSLSAVFVHFIMSFEKFQKFQNLFTLASCLTMLAMGAVVVAFVTGIYSVLAPSLWLAITTCFFGLSFFLLVLCALELIYWRVFLECLHPIWKLFKASHGNVLPTHFKKGN